MPVEGAVGSGPVAPGGQHSPATRPLLQGIPMKKRVMPKASPKSLAMKKNWKASFEKFGSKMGGKRA